METPAAEFAIDDALVRRLLRQQHPDLADRPLRFVANGWDNAIFRVGDDLAVRLPRRQLAADLVEKEQRWMPELAQQLTVPIPAPVRTGRPSDDFPWHWSITPWMHGSVAEFDAAGELVGDLARFIRELHKPAPADAPVNPVRGVPLADRDETVRARLEREQIPDRERILELWSASVRAEPWGGPALWLHGDLHPANLLTDSGRLTAVIDFGDLTAGDPATDLAIAWLILDRNGRTRLRAELPYDDTTWQRSMGWAIIFGSLAVGGDATFQRFGRDAFRELNSETAA